MAIQIHIRIKDSDWDQEHEIAEQLADDINNLIPSELNIPVLVLPVEDQADEMEDLFKKKENEKFPGLYGLDLK